MSAEMPPAGAATAPPLGDWFRAAFLVVAFTALGWVLLTRYSGSSRFDPHRRILRDFFSAAAAHDTTRLRHLVSSEQPLRWALSAAARDRRILPDPDGALEISGASRSAGTEDVVLWVGGPCAEQPYIVTLVGEGRNRRIESVRTDCPVGR
mgnify:CR=1 FL=1